LKVKVITDCNKANIEKSFRFTLFEYYEEELRKITEKYIHGEGIYWDGVTNQAVILELKNAQQGV